MSMTTGALITAAGMSKRMGDFKPMMNIGSISIARRIVASFQQAGITKIVMVTGYNAQALEHHLSGNNIIFLRNEAYESTHMFDSVKIGLEYLKDKVDRILFTPVDVPLFTVSTIDKILSSDAPLARPVCRGQLGHPIMVSSVLADKICAYEGNEGLRGAMENCGTDLADIEVDDEGTIHDADTPEEFNSLLKYHNSQLIRPEISVKISKELPFFDEKMATLLTLTDETHSVREACSRMHISYSNGWSIIRTLETQLSRSLIERTQGGPHGGQSTLTDDGRELLEKYSIFTEKMRCYAASEFEKAFGDFFNSKA